MPLGWAAQRRDGLPGPGVRTVLLTKAGEDLGGRKPRVPETLPPARAPPSSDTSFACTSKGVYENYRRWQRYKALARRHFPTTPDAEALACFFIPVLRSLARLRPDMTLEDGVPRAVQEWEHSSNFERMIFYEMAEKFMEFEAEEEQQIQKMKLLANCSQFQAPAPKPTKPPMSPAPESGQQQVYIPKKSASKSRQPRRRQRRPPSTSATGAPREIPAEAVHQYAEIMEGLDTSWEEDEEKKEQGASKDLQGQEDGAFPDPALAQYIDQLCEDEEFVCKVEAVLHPQFMARLLSLEKNQDPLALVEELEEELNLTPNQLTEKRLLALTEEEREPSMYPTSHSDSTPSQSEEEDE
uniref:Nuclear Testis protein N-terminal domain-containing protein n=3 Tax=Anolis carolinensis TaxID=28377 RepID=H9GEC6_ANOCA